MNESDEEKKCVCVCVCVCMVCVCARADELEFMREEEKLDITVSEPTT